MCVKLSSYTYLVYTGYSHMACGQCLLEYSNKEKKYLTAIVFSLFSKSLFRLRAAIQTGIFVMLSFLSYLRNRHLARNSGENCWSFSYCSLVCTCLVEKMIRHSIIGERLCHLFYTEKTSILLYLVPN